MVAIMEYLKPTTAQSVKGVIVRNMENDLPTDAEIIALHKKYAPSEEVFTIVYSHCLTVWRIAEQLLAAKPQKIDQDLVKTGCMLHDIGTYTLLQPNDPIAGNYMGRGVESERILKEEGLPQALCEIVAHHVSLALTKEQIEEGSMLGVVPYRDLNAKTVEERLVNYASKFHARSSHPSEKPRFGDVAWYRKLLKDVDVESYSNDFEALVKQFGEPDTASLAKELGQELLSA